MELIHLHRAVAGEGPRNAVVEVSAARARELVDTLRYASRVEDAAEAQDELPEGVELPFVPEQPATDPLPAEDAPMAEWQAWAKPRIAPPLPRKKAELVELCRQLAAGATGA